MKRKTSKIKDISPCPQNSPKLSCKAKSEQYYPYKKQTEGKWAGDGLDGGWTLRRALDGCALGVICNDEPLNSTPKSNIMLYINQLECK